MKKFFKALALVLALTLVVGTIPASAAEYEFSLAKEKKIIYLGGASGEKEVDGATVKCGTKSRYKISKLVNGFDPATMDIKLESSDPSIVKTSNAKDKVYAKSIGTADVKIFVYDKETDKQLKDLTVKVQVKKNATAPLAVVVTQEDGTPVDITATKVGVGVPYIVTLPRKDADGNFVDTDYRKIVADKESVQIEAINKYSTQYKVTFTEAGTFAITIGSYQSKIWDKLQNTLTVPVTAGYEAKDAVQYSLDTVKVTFDTPVTKLDAANFKTVYVIDGVDDVEIPFADIAPDGIKIDDNDKTVAYVKYLMPFNANTTYKVYYGTSTEPAGTFKAVEVKADSVKTFVIPTQYVTTETETAIKYQLLDANGVDITSGINAAGGNVTFELTSDDGNDYIIGESVYVKTAHAVTVTGTYHYFDADSNYKSEPVGKGQVVAQLPEAFKVGKVEGIITDGSKLLVEGGKLTDAKEVEWNLDGVKNDGSSIAYLQIKVPYTKSSGTVYEGFNYTTADGTYESYEIDIADKTVAMFEGFEGGMAKLSANKVGSTSILVYGVKGTTKAVIGVVPVTVKDTRKLTSWTVQSSSDKLNLDFGDVTYTINVKDQDTNDYKKPYKVKVEDVTDSNNVKEIKVETEYTGKAEIKITADELKTVLGITKQENAVTRNIKFTITNDNAPKTLRLSIKSDGEKAARYLLKLSGGEIKTGITGTTKLTDDNKVINVYLEGVTSNGTQASASGVSITFSKDAPKAHKLADGESKDDYFVFTITKDGKLIDKPEQLAGATFNAYNAVASGAAVEAKKLASGTYVINGYRFYLNSNDTWNYDNVGTAQQFTVTDDQAPLTWKKTAESVADFTPSDVVGAFEIKIGDDTVTYGKPGYSFVVDVNVDDDKTAYVKSIKVTVLNGNVGNYTYEIKPDVLLKK